MWKWLLKGILYVSSNPAVRQWARRKVAKLIQLREKRAEQQISDLYTAVGLEVPKPPELPRPKVVKMIRTVADTLKPGNVVIVEGEPFQIKRLLSASAKEATYEAESL